MNRGAIWRSIQEASDIGVENPVHAGGADPDSQGIERIVLTAPWPESVREPEEVFLVDRTEHHDHRALDDFVFQGSDPQRAQSTVLLQDEPSPDGQRPVAAAMNPCMQVLKVVLQPYLVVLPRQLLHRASRDPRRMKRMCNSSAASGIEVGLYLVPRTRTSVGPAAPRAPRTVARGLVPLSTHLRLR
jgi:hypothetical protein